MKYLQLIILVSIAISCQHTGNEITEVEFQKLMKNIGEGWSTQNTEKALSSFDEDAIYMEPPNNQYFRGHRQLKPYFDKLTSVHKMEFHNLWFNSKTQSGTGEFTFSYGTDTSTVGVVVVELGNGKIKFWREYLQIGPTDFKDFLRIENKEWEWHIGNYPESQDSININ